jgi:hypothetical protein
LQPRPAPAGRFLFVDMKKRKAAIAAGVAAAIAVAAWGAWWKFDPRWYTARELEHAARPERRIDIDPMPMSGGIEYFGRIHFDLYIGRDGRVDRVENLESTLPDAVRDRIVKSFSEARWYAARRPGGREVRSVKRIEVNYEAPKGVERRPMAPDS